jgi:hypothetical protein
MCGAVPPLPCASSRRGAWFCLGQLYLTQPLIQLVAGAISLGVKQPGREGNHSPPSSTEVKNAWSCASTHLCVFIAWYLVGARATLPYTIQWVRGALPWGFSGA